MVFPHGIRSISRQDEAGSSCYGGPVGLLSVSDELSFRHCRISRRRDCVCRSMRRRGDGRRMSVPRSRSQALYAALVTVFFPAAQRTTAMTRMSELWNPELRAEGNYADRSADRTSLLSYLPEHPRELLIGVGPGNFRWYQAQRITINIYGHNSYLHWTGELGIGGFLLLLAWCLSVCLYAKKRLRSQPRICQLAARTCLAVVAGRMVAAWGAESLFGTDGMGYYSLFFVGVVYLLVSIASDVGRNGFLLPRAAQSIQES